MSLQSQKKLLFPRDSVCFTTCFGQHGHLHAIQRCTEYMEGNYQRNVF